MVTGYLPSDWRDILITFAFQQKLSRFDYKTIQPNARELTENMSLFPSFLVSLLRLTLTNILLTGEHLPVCSTVRADFPVAQLESVATKSAR